MHHSSRRSPRHGEKHKNPARDEAADRVLVELAPSTPVGFSTGHATASTVAAST